MKVLIRVLVFILFSAGFIFLQAQSAGNLTGKERFRKTKVKTLTDYFYFLDNPKLKGFKVQKKYFNREGYDTLVESFSITDGKVFSKNVKEYDKNGNFVKKTDYKVLVGNNQNKNEKLHREKTKKNDDYISNNFNIELISYFFYDSLGNPKGRKEFDSQGNLLKEYKIDYTYNREGKILESIGYNSDIKETLRNVYTYDTKWNKIGHLCYDYEGKLTTRFIYSYDSLNNLIKMLTCSPEGKVKEKFIWKYDERNNGIERNVYENDTVLTSKNIFVYNEKNKIIELTRIPFDNKQDYLRARTTYDKYGNVLTNKRYNKKNKPFRLQKFVYTYYK